MCASLYEQKLYQESENCVKIRNGGKKGAKGKAAEIEGMSMLKLSAPSLPLLVLCPAL